jgi:FKBP-type peptidyl-prolyl cis-trans isomerase
MSTQVNTSFPDHNIDPRSKNSDWILRYIKAAWEEFSSGGHKIFWNNRERYAEIKSYAQGAQATNKYKPLMGVDEENDETWLNIDWTIIPIIPKFRRIALNKLNKVQFNITATPIDSSAIADKEEHISEIKARIKLKEALDEVNPELSKHPLLQAKPGEPEDMDGVELYSKYTYKHRLSKEMEKAIKLVFFQNKFEENRELLKEDFFDYGVGWFKEYIDSNGAVRKRKCMIPNMIVSPCQQRDFSDKRYAGEIIEITFAQLKQWAGTKFTTEQYEEIGKQILGKNGNPSYLPSYSNASSSFDPLKIRVVDMEFFSVNEDVYEKRVNRRGNKVFGLTDYGNKNRVKDKYVRSAYQVVYKGCWIMDTKFIFNEGLCTDMKRIKDNLVDTDLSYHGFAPDFYNMKAVGLMEQLIPIADQIQLAWYHLQNVIASAKPRGVAIEIGALEDVPLGKGGKKMSPLDIVDLYFKKGVLVYRKLDGQGRASNYKPIEELQNGLGDEANRFFQQIQGYIQMARDIIGMNEFTDGSTPDPKTLTTVANAAIESSNNSLFQIIDGERNLLTRVACAVTLRLQDAIQKGPIEGYVRALGNDTVELIRVSSEISAYEYGIQLEIKPTDEQRQRLMAYVQASLGDGANGNIDMEDAVFIENVDNIKEAQEVLAYRIKKKTKERERQAKELEMVRAQANAQAAQVAEQAKQQTLQMEIQLKGQLIQLEKDLELRNAREKGQLDLLGKQIESGAKVDVARLYNGQDPDSSIQPSAIQPVTPESMQNMQQQMQQAEQPAQQAA